VNVYVPIHIQCQGGDPPDHGLANRTVDSNGVSPTLSEPGSDTGVCPLDTIRLEGCSTALQQVEFEEPLDPVKSKGLHEHESRLQDQY
jgi:hypothetical protein